MVGMLVSVLLIEDTIGGETLMEFSLRSLRGIETHTATTWSMATRMVPAADVIVADLNLPDVIDSRETAEAICRLAATMPVVVCSNIDPPEIRKQCEAAGVIDFLRKDKTTADQLRAAVEVAVSKTRRRMTESEIVRLSTPQINELKGHDLV